MRGRIFSNYDLIDLDTEQGRKQFFGAITAYCRRPNDVQKKLLEAGITAFTASEEFPREITELIETYHLGLEEIDAGYEKFFDVRDFSGVRTPGFRLRSTSSGLTFAKRAEGGRAHIYRVTGEEVFVGFDMYGGGLEFDQAWFDDQEWWMVEDTAKEFRSKWFSDKADIMYNLIGNLSATYNTAFTVTDIGTINAGCYALLSGLVTAGYNVTMDTQIIMLSPVALKSRVLTALAQQRVVTGVAASQVVVEYNVLPVFSLKVKNAGVAAIDIWYLGVAGMKNKLGEKMPLTIYSNFKAENYATTTVGWGRYGAYLNEVQMRRLATA